MQIATVIYYHN